MTAIAAALPAVVLCALLLIPMDPSPYLHTTASREVFDRSGKLLFASLNGEEQWLFPRPFDAISPYLVKATIAAEDQRFYSHPGVDTIAILRAVGQNVWGGGIHSGASTITMQVVKRGSPSTRTIAGKLYQAVQALRLERHASKTQILEAYLNTAPYGLNLVGCESAARRYFGKPSVELTLSEAATLAALPKSPTALMPLAKSAAAKSRRDYVLQRMRDDGYISPQECEHAMAEPVTAAWHDFPLLSPHLAMRLSRASEEGARIHTTLDARIQLRCERLIAETLKTFDNQVTNAAVIVVDTESGKVIARVGSSDFFNTPGGGQVDACQAARSPGSALKPFTYALGMERQELYPTEYLLDDSLDYGLYSPENFDQEYRGLVSASYALKRSLNVPAVLVLERIGEDNMYRFLRRAGLSSLTREAEFYGLGLTLGNCEVRLEDLTAAYLMLANLGAYRPLRYAADEPPRAARQLLSRSTCLGIYDMLEQPLPTDFQKDIVRASGTPPRVCWKTGTSSGYHDAWSFMFNRHYVVGVWLGNNDGRASRMLVGAKAALPLAARIFRFLPQKQSPFWPEPGDDLSTVTICAVSGLPASRWCTRTSTAQFPADLFLNRCCDVHYPRPLGDVDTGTPVVERWPAAARNWDLAHIVSPLPAQQPMLAKSERIVGLRILEPANNAEFILTREANADRIRVRSSLDTTATTHWYLDSLYLGESGPGKDLFVDLLEGEHRLTCMTLDGQTDSVKYTVELPEGSARFKTK
ncbi:MAG: penicillin-binding protein 1C [Candidatus Hydrogenedentes bacterium]|nr:penicillin-binding protein 1C [Candidatus Hydrogenedentota bacterium]